MNRTKSIVLDLMSCFLRPFVGCCFSIECFTFRTRDNTALFLSNPCGIRNSIFSRSLTYANISHLI